MAAEQFANDIQTTLSAELTEGATTVKVTSATGFPAAAQYRIRIDSEIMLVTAGAGTTEWTVTRAAEGTTAAPHLKSAVVAHVLTAEVLKKLTPQAVYRTLITTTGRGSVSGASGTKYFCNPSAADNTAPTTASNGVIVFPYVAADYASAATTKLRLQTTCIIGTAATVSITMGLYPISIAASAMSLGTVVEGSTITFTTPGGNSITTQNSGDFTPPADGTYAVGYTLSGIPLSGLLLPSVLQVRGV